jgi:aldehyde:ferredoxin oxidoreductase
MSKKEVYGYMGKILKVDLSGKKSWTQELDEEACEKYVGGVALGAKYLIEEVPPGVQWSSPENRLILMTGPFAGTRISGSGTFCALSKGPMTNMAASTQANGFFGAFLRFSGYDGVIIQGKASNLIYLYIHETGVEFHDASHLMGKGTLETQESIKKELNLGRKLSVFTIGPAGENLIRFSGIVGDGGHVAAHNGIGAVMGSKNLKAIAVHRGNCKPPIKDPEQHVISAKELLKHAKNFDNGRLFKWGTNGTFAPQSKTGEVPVKNYTTNILEGHEKLLPEYQRSGGRRTRI